MPVLLYLFSRPPLKLVGKMAAGSGKLGDTLTIAQCKEFISNNDCGCIDRALQKLNGIDNPEGAFHCTCVEPIIIFKKISQMSSISQTHVKTFCVPTCGIDGAFGAHLKDAKVHSGLNKHYRWRGMRTDIIRWRRRASPANQHYNIILHDVKDVNYMM